MPPEVKPAMSQLWDAADYAVRYLASLRRLGGLHREDREELLIEWKLRTVRHFLAYKVMRHTYARQAKNGKCLNFFDNVLSSALSSWRQSFEYLRVHWLEKAAATDDIDRAVPGTELRFCDLIGDDFTNKIRYTQKNWRTNPCPRKLLNHSPGQRKKLYENTYEIVCEDRQEMGLEPMPFEEFLKLCTEGGDIVDEAIESPLYADRVEPGGFWWVDENGKRHLTDRGREWNRKYRQMQREANRKIREERAKCWEDPDYFPPETARKK